MRIPWNLIGGLGIVAGLAAQLAGCQTTTTPSPDTYMTAVAEEYQQLGRLRPPVPFNLRAGVAFERKAWEGLRGRCMEPERLIDWPGADDAVIRDPPPGGWRLADLRARLIGLELEARTAPPDRQRAFPDLPRARAHMLGRFDCLVVFGRFSRDAVITQRCATEFAGATSYVQRAVQGLPAATDDHLCADSRS